MKTKSEIREACEEFLEDWDRQLWMQDNGEWASAAWDDARDEYDEAVRLLREAVEDLPDADRISYRTGHTVDRVADLSVMLVAAAEALDGQVTPDESDYIETGTIDPDGIRDHATLVHDGDSGSEWDCREGWEAYRHGDALYVRWYRDAWGARHDRDLWVPVDAEFFAED